MSGIPEPARPAPRRARNTFAQSAANAATAEPVAQQPDATPVTAATRTATPATPRATKPATAATRHEAVARKPRKRKVQTTDILLSLPEELKERMVATLDHTRPRTGIRSQQMFIRLAIEQLCARLEDQHNGGERFPQPADEIDI